MAATRHRNPVKVRPVRAVEWRELRDLRLRALKSDPRAFGSTFDREAAYPDAEWIQWAEASEAGERRCTFIALGAEGWQGMAFATLLDDGDAGLYGVWVEPSYRRMGIATALVDAVEAWAHERQASGISLSVAEDNVAAEAAFGSNGFALTQTRGRLRSRPDVGTLAMRRPIGSAVDTE